MSPFVIIVLGALLMAGMLWLKALPPHRRGSAVIKLVILSLIAALVILTVTGRIHWIGALFAGVFLLYKKYGFLLKAIPFLGKLFKSRAKAKQPPSPNNQHMQRTEALKILGLEEGCSDEEIILAHRKLMQKFHPDHGGNSYLAAQLNEARACLLKR